MAKEKTSKQTMSDDTEENVMDAIVDEQHDENVESETDEQQTVEEITLSKEELDKLRSEVLAMKQAMDTAISDAQRIQAEFNNYRKRNASLRTDSHDDGVREAIKQLLPVLDNFERAVQNSDESSFAKGTEQIYKQLIETLNKLGLEEISAEGKFDPNLHDAVILDEEGEGESGTITAVLQKGYTVKGKIIRHAMVKVKA